MEISLESWDRFEVSPFCLSLFFTLFPPRAEVLGSDCPEFDCDGECTRKDEIRFASLYFHIPIRSVSARGSAYALKPVFMKKYFIKIHVDK